MLQLKPDFKCSAHRKAANTSIYKLDYFGPQVQLPELSYSNRFPFRDAIIFYLNSKLKNKKNPKLHFMSHNLRKKLNVYYKTCKITENVIKNKEAESEILNALRDVIIRCHRDDELAELQDYWLYKLSDYFTSKTIADQKASLPRLKQFINKRIHADLKRLNLLKKMARNWKLKSGGKLNNNIKKWIKTEYKPSIEFIERSLKNKELFVRLNIGNERSQDNRHFAIEKTAALLNLTYNALGAEINPELKLEMKKGQKPLKKSKNISQENVTFIVKDSPRFNASRALRSICKRHLTLGSSSKEHNKTETTEENNRDKVKCYPNVDLNKSLPKVELNPVKEMIPYSKGHLESCKKKAASKSLSVGHLLFLEDLQNVFSTYAKEFVAQKDLGKILLKDSSHEDNEVKPPFPTSRTSKDDNRESSVLENRGTFDSIDADDDEVAEIHDDKAGANREDVTVTLKNTAIKKASYIVLRILEDLATKKYLSSYTESGNDSESAYSSFSQPVSENVQVIPFMALKSLLSSKKSDKILQPALKNLKQNAKTLYTKINQKDKQFFLNQFKEIANNYSRQHGIDLGEEGIKDLLEKWDFENSQTNGVSSSSSQSTNSAVKGLEPTLFEHTEMPGRSIRTKHLNILCLLLLFLFVSEKIVSVRNAVHDFFKDPRRVITVSFKNKKEKVDKEKDKYRDKRVYLPHFRNFLSHNRDLHDIDLYVAIGKKYCPDYIFYENDEDLKSEKLVLADNSDDSTKSKESIKQPSVNETDFSVDKKDESTPTVSGAEESGSRQYENGGKIKLKEDQSYMSWQGPPCKRAFSKKPRIYFMKRTTEGSNLRDFGEPTYSSIPKDGEDFEYPTLSNIPRLVTRYNKGLIPSNDSGLYLLGKIPTPT